MQRLVHNPIPDRMTAFSAKVNLFSLYSAYSLMVNAGTQAKNA